MNFEIPYTVADYNTYVLIAYLFTAAVLSIVVTNSVSSRKRHKKKLADREKNTFR